MAGFPKQKNAKRPKPGCTFDKKVIHDLITQCDGNVTRVADTIGASRGGVRGFIDKHPELVELVRQARERQLDQLEQSCFDRAIETNDTTLQLFLLKTQGKSRGYDQNEAQHAARDIATAAFDFIVSKQGESSDK